MSGIPDPNVHQQSQFAHTVGAAISAALAPMLTSLASQSQAISALAAAQSAPRSNLIDTRGMGRPPSFSGAVKDWREWKGKMTAYLKASDPQADRGLNWAEKRELPVTLEAIEGICVDPNTGMRDAGAFQLAQAFDRKLFCVLIDTCKEEPYRIVEGAANECGLEAWRLLMRR